MQSTSSVAIALLLLGAMGASAAHAQSARFHELGTLPGARNSGAYVLSSDGRWIGGWARNASGRQVAAAWRLAGDGIEIIDVGDLPGGLEGGTVQGISADGSVMTGPSESENGREAFRWTVETGMQPLGDLPGGAFASHANAISDDGRVIVGFGTTDLGIEATMWTEDGIRSLGIFPGGTDSYASAITPDGRVIVGMTRTSDGVRAFRWTEETGMVPIEHGGVRTHGLAVSDDGRVVAGYAKLPWGDTFFVWSMDEGMLGGGDLPNGEWESWPWDLNHDGSIAFGYGSDADGKTAVVWDRWNGMRKYQDVLAQDYGIVLPAGWHLKGVEGISRDGRVVIGYGTSPRFGTEGFVLEMPPQCSDGVDNDFDGQSDHPADPGCSDAAASPEDPACDDGVDNDRDGAIDFEDSACSATRTRSETAIRRCGVGLELVFAVAVLSALRRRAIVGRGILA